MIIAFTGSKHVKDEEQLRLSLSLLKAREDITLVHVGDCAGVDEIVRRVCDKNSIPVKVFYTDWWSYGTAATPIRTSKMLESADLFICVFGVGKDNEVSRVAMQQAHARGIDTLSVWVKVDNV